MELPNPENLSKIKNIRPTRFVDRKGYLLYEIYTDKKFEPVKLSVIPKNVIDATLAIEDSAFFSHKGVNIKGILRATKAIILKNDLQGGSTITQQLIKNVLLSPERTFERKFKEIVLALVVETKYSKNDILEMYFNNTPYGGNAWGIQTASQVYFGKDVSMLNLAEASLLAGLPQAPTSYSPFLDFESAKNRQKQVLDRMVLLGNISEQESTDAFATELALKEPVEFIKSPHFINNVRKDLEEKFGKRYVDFGGLVVTTTLDLSLQEKVQKIITDEVEKSKSLNISNAATVVLDVKTGEVLAYVGSVDYFKPKWGAFDVATTLRQPGSSIKPLTYSLALENGYTPASIIKDVPMLFKVQGLGSYRPVNYDGKYHGDVTLRQALANSYNIPAVYLASKLGPEKIVALGQRLGLQGWDVNGSYGLSVTLGGEEVRLLDLTNVYATFGRYGNFKPPQFITSIEDPTGYITTSNSIKNERVVSDEVAYLIWNILSDSKAREAAFGSTSALVIPNHKVAVKTGTTDAKRDNWTFGFTPNYAVGVWVGNNDNTPMNPALASGLSGAAPIWNKIMTEVLSSNTSTLSEEMEPSDNIVIKAYKDCNNKTEVFIKGSKIPVTICGETKEKKKDS